MNKVFGIGFQRTGTTSLRDALRLLGYKCGRHSPYLYPELRKGIFTSTFMVADRYDAVQDFPWPLIYKELDIAYPGSKFILTIRDSESWLRSMANMAGTKGIADHRDIYGNVSAFPMKCPEAYVERFERHNSEVMEYFLERQNDLLVFDARIDHQWNSICPFLGREIPGVPYPHRNNGTAAPANKKHERKAFGSYIRRARSMLRQSLRRRSNDEAKEPMLCVLLGGDWATGFLGSLLNLHPRCQVLHQVSERVLGIPALDSFLNYSPEIYQELRSFLIHESVNGAVSPISGFETSPLQSAYEKRFGAGPARKGNIASVIWSGGQTLGRHIDSNFSGAVKTLENEQSMRLVWVGGVDVVDSDSESEMDVFDDLKKMYPHQVISYALRDLGGDDLRRLADFLGLDPDKHWINEAMICSGETRKESNGR